MRRRDGRVAVTSVAEGRRWPGDGLAWAEVGHTGQAVDGPMRKIKKELRFYGQRAELAMGCEKLFPQFSNKDLSFKIKDWNAFKPNLNWSKLVIDLK
jgi:hypothetical protein